MNQKLMRYTNSHIEHNTHYMTKNLHVYKTSQINKSNESI